VVAAELSPLPVKNSRSALKSAYCATTLTRQFSLLCLLLDSDICTRLRASGGGRIHLASASVWQSFRGLPLGSREAEVYRFATCAWCLGASNPLTRPLGGCEDRSKRRESVMGKALEERVALDPPVFRKAFLSSDDSVAGRNPTACFVFPPARSSDARASPSPFSVSRIEVLKWVAFCEAPR
jgi:hypothetical protein